MKNISESERTYISCRDGMIAYYQYNCWRVGKRDKNGIFKPRILVYSQSWFNHYYRRDN